MIIHAGDFISPITFDYMKDIDVPFLGVFGNNDGEKNFSSEQDSKISANYTKDASKVKSQD